MDAKYIASNRPIYNNVWHTRVGMFPLYKWPLVPIFLILFNLFFISLVTIDQNMANAQIRDNTTNPYQTPLFASLDDRKEEEEVNTNLRTAGIEMIRQNATLDQTQTSSSSNIRQVPTDLDLPTNSSFSREDTHSQGVQSYNSSLDSTFFYLDDVPFRHQRTQVNGISMHYVIGGGNGDPVVLLHGWPQTWYEWRYIMPMLVKNNYTVVVPDLRGLGDTSRPSTGYDSRTTAEDIYKLVSHLGFKQKILLVGHDIGAQTAYSYTLSNTNNVSKLAVIDSVLPGLISSGTTAEPWWFAFQRTPDLPEALVSGNEREYLSWFYRQLAYNPYSISEQDIDEYVRHYSAPGGMRSGFEYFRTSSSLWNNHTSNSELNVPTLAIFGEISYVNKPDNAIDNNKNLESIRRLAKNVSYVVVPSSGHWIPEEQPGFLFDSLVNFFEDNNNTISSSLQTREKGLPISSSIKDLISKMSNNNNSTILNSTLNGFQTSNVSEGSLADQTSSLPLESLLNMQVLQQQSLSVASTTSPKDQASNNTIIEKQNYTGPTNQTIVSSDDVKKDMPVINLTRNVIQKQENIDNSTEERIADQETPLSIAGEAIRKMLGW